MEEAFWISISTFFIGLGIGLSLRLYYIEKLTKKQSIADPIISNQATPQVPINMSCDHQEEPSDDNNIMTIETKIKIIQNLEKFESSQIFIKNNVSLPYVAGYLGTNTKYLSNIIKTFKNKDFNAYINDLRIDYILRKLNEEKEYRNYKISSLAEDAGYSSHSKFATIFKNTVGVSPSTYIQHLEEEKELSLT